MALRTHIWMIGALDGPDGGLAGTTNARHLGAVAEPRDGMCRRGSIAGGVGSPEPLSREKRGDCLEGTAVHQQGEKRGGLVSILALRVEISFGNLTSCKYAPLPSAAA
jgi:hypothetical protein